MSWFQLLWLGCNPTNKFWIWGWSAGSRCPTLFLGKIIAGSSKIQMIQAMARGANGLHPKKSHNFWYIYILYIYIFPMVDFVKACGVRPKAMGWRFGDAPADVAQPCEAWRYLNVVDALPTQPYISRDGLIFDAVKSVHLSCTVVFYLQKLQIGSLWRSHRAPHLLSTVSVAGPSISSILIAFSGNPGWMWRAAIVLQTQAPVACKIGAYIVDCIEVVGVCVCDCA